MKTKEIKLAIAQNAINRDDVWQWWFNKNTAWCRSLKKESSWATWQDYKKEGVTLLSKRLDGMIRREWKRNVDGKIERGFSVARPIGLVVLTKEGDEGLEIEYYDQDDEIDNDYLHVTGIKPGSKPLFQTEKGDNW